MIDQTDIPAIIQILSLGHDHCMHIISMYNLVTAIYILFVLVISTIWIYKLVKRLKKANTNNELELTLLGAIFVGVMGMAGLDISYILYMKIVGIFTPELWLIYRVL